MAAWHFECPKSEIHRWKRNDDGTATCLNCGQKLTKDEADDCFTDYSKRGQ